MKYEGITVTRDKNEIDDLVPGVTINLLEPTDKTETLTVKPDTAGAKESIITFVANYNRVIAEINILTQDQARNNFGDTVLYPGRKKGCRGSARA